MKRNSLAFVFLGIITIIGLFLACGQIGNLRGKDALEYDLNSFPTAENMKRWESFWRKNEWVVSLKGDTSAQSADKNFVKSLLQNFVSNELISNSTQEVQAIAAQFVSGFEVQFVSNSSFDLPNEMFPKIVQGLAANKNDTYQQEISGFAFLKLPSRIPVGLQQGSFFSEFDFSNATGQLDFLMKAFAVSGSSPNAKWIEPNLESKIQQVGSGASGSQLPPEFNQSSLMSEVLERMKANKAYEFVNSQENRKLSNVNVAVLDTGVDFGHPELKEQMFVNPNEIAGDKIDNDNNCHSDDIHGIDATVDCSNDFSIAPVPGAADLGGPNSTCPFNATDELSRNCGHGTHVAGIIAAKHGGDLSTLGICPSCRIISVRVSERCLQPDTSQRGTCVKPLEKVDGTTKWEVDSGIADSSQIRGLNYLLSLRSKERSDRLLVNVVNMSLGKYFRSRAMSYLLRRLSQLNIAVVAASGNDNVDIPSYPAAYSGVVSVCATGTASQRGILVILVIG
jgi:hypothetical protein